jgi:hypothetical protein
MRFLERPMAGDGQRPALVGGGYEAEKQLGAGVVERGEPYFVTDDQVRPQDGLDHLAHRVVRQAPVERLDELSGDEVADLVAGVDGGVAEGDQAVAFPGAGRAHEARVLLGPHPFQAGQVVERGPGDRRCRKVEVFKRLDAGNANRHVTFSVVVDVDPHNPRIRRLPVQRRLLARRYRAGGVSD